MEYRPLGRTGLEVSVIGLGTMTWGKQNTEVEAHAQLDRALDAGVNLVDTAEMYPVPPEAETQGLTEQYLGTWLHRSGRRGEIVLASKCSGPSRGMAWIRGGRTRFSSEHLVAAVEASLARLRTDHIDLYQLHWPDRTVPMFGGTVYRHDPDEEATPPEETLRALQDLVSSGKIGAVGLSNETPWGVMRFLGLSEALGLPRVQSVQNAYSLLNRTYEHGLAEISHREDCGLLAYSPLAMGLLTGKYEGGRVMPDGARLSRFTRFSRYSGPRGLSASERYVQLARDAGLDPAQMALAFINSRGFVTSNLIGATTLEQLDANLGSADVVLDDDLLQAIDAVHHAVPNPCP